jgi:hypothetical protein
MPDVMISKIFALQSTTAAQEKKKIDDDNFSFRRNFVCLFYTKLGNQRPTY